MGSLWCDNCGNYECQCSRLKKETINNSVCPDCGKLHYVKEDIETPLVNEDGMKYFWCPKCERKQCNKND